jgi:hypothetical protein
MAPQRTLHLVICCLLAGTLVGAVAPAAAAPPPRPLCDACGDAFEATAEAQGAPLTVENSTATVTVHENGSATWIVHNHVVESDMTARLRSNETKLTAITDDAMWDTEFLGATISTNGVITMRYRAPDFATRSVGGVLQSGVFTEAYGYGNLDGLGAGRLTVIAPNGTQVGWTVPGAAVSDDGQQMTVTQFDEGGFVTFVPQDTVLGPLLSLLAVGSLLGPVMAINVLVYVGLPTAVFTLLIGAIAGALSWTNWEYSRIQNRAGIGLGVLGLLGTTGSLVATGGVSLLGGAAAPLFGAGITFVVLGVVYSRQSVRDRMTYRRLVGVGVLGAGIASVVTAAGAIGFGQNGLTQSLLTSLPLLLPVFLLIPTGYALGRENRRLAIGTAAVGFALSIVPLAPFTSPTIGAGLLLSFVATMYAVIIAIIGVPLLVVGVSFAKQAPADQ